MIEKTSDDLRWTSPVNYRIVQCIMVFFHREKHIYKESFFCILPFSVFIVFCFFAFVNTRTLSNRIKFNRYSSRSSLLIIRNKMSSMSDRFGWSSTQQPIKTEERTFSQPMFIDWINLPFGWSYQKRWIQLTDDENKQWWNLVNRLIETKRMTNTVLIFSTEHRIINRKKNLIESKLLKIVSM